MRLLRRVFFFGGHDTSAVPTAPLCLFGLEKELVPSLPNLGDDVKRLSIVSNVGEPNYSTLSSVFFDYHGKVPVKSMWFLGLQNGCSFVSTSYWSPLDLRETLGKTATHQSPSMVRLRTLVGKQERPFSIPFLFTHDSGNRSEEAARKARRVITPRDLVKE